MQHAAGPSLNVGDSIRITCLPIKRRGRKQTGRSIRGRVVYMGDTYLTVQHQPAGWRECFLYADIRSGNVKVLPAEP